MRTNYTHKVFIAIIMVLISISLNATDYIINQPSGTFSVLGTNYIDYMSEVWYINTGVSKPIKLNFNLDSEEG